ncbi:glycoside hydrolase family 19 protein [Algicola sagamiensis]|uniref:glycoside hydrolase family 19 protein n=1 Tax=Algicola sagamiensis TaxID=163869 RepID=UPI00037EF3E6|nr:glycoside hydrolase family 19 protein [Algicola sagamiensis]
MSRTTGGSLVLSGIGLLFHATAFALPEREELPKTSALLKWDSHKTYLAQDEIHYQQDVYRAKWWTQGDVPQPQKQSSPWDFLYPCDTRCKSDDTQPPKKGPQPKEGGGYTILRDEIMLAEQEKTSFPLFQQVKASIETRSNQVVEQVMPNRSSNPENVKRVEHILSQADWNEIFPMRHPAYTYRRFLQAVAKFEGFCASFEDGRNAEVICRQSLATMFAHFTQETGGHDPNSEIDEWRQGLVHVREMGCEEGGYGCGYNAECDPGTWQGKTWPCGTNAEGRYLQYFGRGAKQLSYNYNYGPFSQAMFGDVRVLLEQPTLVADTWLNLASAVFFFVYPQSPKPSMQHVIDGTWQPNDHDQANGILPGFGATTNIINGGIECGSGSESPQSTNRIAYYKAHAKNLGVDISGESLGCADQKRFDTSGAGALNIYWDQDWSYYPDMPEGKSFACKLVGYQTAFLALNPGNYQSCVEKYFDVEVVEQHPVSPRSF